MTHFSSPFSPPPLPSRADTSAALCPRCQSALTSAADGHGPKRCTTCRWRGWAQDFTPPPRVVEQAQTAMPDDVTCAHHPTKKAVTVCAGTGSYICALCAIEVEGQTYSADFINRGGLKKAGKTTVFERTMPRPDNAVGVLVFLTFFPHCTPLAIIWMPCAIYQYVRHRRQMREDATYASVTRPTLTLIGLIAMLLYGSALLVLAIVLSVAAILGDQ